MQARVGAVRAVGKEVELHVRPRELRPRPGKSAGKPGVRLIHVGDRAGQDAPVPGALLRSLGATISGFLPVWSGPEAIATAYRRLCEAAAAGELDVPTESVPLAEVAQAWARYPSTRHKLVLVP